MGRSNKGGIRLSRKILTNLLMDYFRENQDRQISIKELREVFALKKHPMQVLCADIVMRLTEEGYLVQTGGFFTLAHKKSVLEGVIQVRTGGRAYFVSDQESQPIFIGDASLKGAGNGDRVKVTLYARRQGKQPEGEVIEILKRAKETFVGTVQMNYKTAYLVTLAHHEPDILIPSGKLHGAKDGDKAVVKVIEWPSNSHRNPVGKVVEVLGQGGEHETEMHAILAEYGLPYSYPESVEAAANEIPTEIPADVIAEREDFRDVITFTIDPRDAKDFDDAISIQSMGKDLYQVGVHIADVSYYVTEGGIIDKEAYKRATSIYLVDRTIPMLPEKLCNNLCSLRPDEDKLAYSVIFTIDIKGKVHNSRICRTVIRSNRRFVYEEAQAIIERQLGMEQQTEQHDALPGSEYTEQIMVLDSIAKILRKKRFDNGAVNFDRVEVRFDIDSDGTPLSVYFKESKDAHKLVEEFMLLANKTVAEFVGKPQGPGNRATRAPKTFVYRIHDQPDPERMANLAQFVQRFGYKVKTTGTNADMSQSLNKLLAQVKGKTEEDLVTTISLRAMQKARYSTDNIGHYGLAFDYYTHFTSPIRRYPDLMVHRLLTRYLADGRTVMKNKYEDCCDHCSSMEQLAEQAERSSIKYKQVEYMSQRKGLVYDAIISGVAEWGIYAEIIENKCEGLIHIRNLQGDYYCYDDKNYCIKGQNTGKRYRLGDKVQVMVAECDLEKKRMDYELV